MREDQMTIVELPRIYVAHPLITYGTDWSAACLQCLRKLLPNVDLIDPEDQSWSAESWLFEWPWVLGGLSAVVVFGDGDGSVGTGCIREVTDAVFLGLPVWAFDGRRLVELTGFQLLPEWRRTARRAAVLVVGRPLRLAKVLAQARQI
jgi:hypothetical protein